MNMEKIDKNYFKALNFFCMDVEEKARALELCIKKKDLNLYISIVNALKNTMLNMGVVKTAEMARELEKAYEREAIHFIVEYNKKFISELSVLHESIKAALDYGFFEISMTVAGDIVHLKASLIRIKKALRDMAIAEVNRILNELKSMTWENEIRDAIIKISRCILLFEYDQAISLIDEIVILDIC